MPLRIKLAEGDQLVINGAVVQSADGTATLIFHNHCDILRRREIMQEAEADTPARLVYYTLQCAYLFKTERLQYLTLSQNYLSQYLQAAPSAAPIIDKIEEEISKEQYYQAMKVTSDLIDHESERLRAAQRSQR